MTSDSSTKKKTVKQAGLVAVFALVFSFLAVDEGVVLETYDDPVLGAALPTVCLGKTGAGVVPGKTYTLQECLDFTNEDIALTWRGVVKCTPQAESLLVNEAAVIIGLAYNIGIKRFCSSTMAALIRAGKPALEWCRELTHAKNSKGEQHGFTYAGGKRIRGLINRRYRDYQRCVGVDSNRAK